MAEIETTPQAATYSEGSFLPQEEYLEIGRRKKRYLIGIPKETQNHETRVGLTPLSVETLVSQGHKVWIEAGAGEKANFPDLAYSEAGARIITTHQEVFQCDIILKISPFSSKEISWLKENQIIFSALYFPTLSDETLRNQMQKKVTAIAFEYLKDQQNTHPVVRAMNEISGSSSILIASEYLSTVHRGKGVLLGGFTGITPSEVIIVGAGTASEFAARTALGLGAWVKVFDRSVHKLLRLQNNLGQRLFTSVLHEPVLAKALKTADVVIGAMEYQSPEVPFVVREHFIQKMKKGSVIVDLNIDQGGCFETSTMTNHHEPVFTKFGVVHYCVPNIAARVARTASIALSDIFVPIISQIGDAGGIRQALRENPGLRQGVYIYKGILTNTQLGNNFDIPSRNIDLLTPAF